MIITDKHRCSTMTVNLRRHQSSPQVTSVKIEGFYEDLHVLSLIEFRKKLLLNRSNLYWVSRRPTQELPKFVVGGIVCSTFGN